MSDQALLYSDEYIKKILEGPSLFSDPPDISTTTESNLPEQLEKLKKKRVRLELMTRMLTEYLKSNVIREGYR